MIFACDASSNMWVYFVPLMICITICCVKISGSEPKMCLANQPSSMSFNTTTWCEDSWRWNPQYDTPPVEYILLKVQVIFPHSLLKCACLAVSGGQPLFTLGLLVCFIPLEVDFLSLMWGPVPISIFCYLCHKYHFKDTHKILKKPM